MCSPAHHLDQRNDAGELQHGARHQNLHSVAGPPAPGQLRCNRKWDGSSFKGNGFEQAGLGHVENEWARRRPGEFYDPRRQSREHADLIPSLNFRSPQIETADVMLFDR